MRTQQVAWSSTGLIENPLDEAADAHCSVKAPRANHSVTIVAPAIPAAGERTLTTRMEHLPEDMKPEGLIPFCTLDA